MGDGTSRIEVQQKEYEESLKKQESKSKPESEKKSK
jgi:hypothetical protein